MRTTSTPARRLLGRLGICLATMTLFSALANALDSGPAAAKKTSSRPRIGLVLSGGGARGIAHIGVLKALELSRIPVDYIAGTSMGAIIGGAYASGMSIEEMTDFVLSTDWNDVFTDDPGRNALSPRRKALSSRNLFGLEVGLQGTQFKIPSGAISGQKLDLIMDDLGKRASGITNFNNLPIPFRATATDLETGELFLFDKGSLATAMRASMSVPGIIAPIEYQDHILVDGGLVRNLPVDIVRQMGADVVIAVNLGTPLLKRDELVSILGVAVQMIAILTEQNVQRSLSNLHKDDVLILPELGVISAASFERAEEAIQSGITATQKVLPQLRRYSLPPREYLVHRGTQVPRIARAPRVVDEIRIGQLQRVNPESIESALQTQPGEELSEPQMKKDLARLYGRGDFERINYRFFEEDGNGVVAIDAYEKRWGPNYLRFGLDLDSDFQGATTAFNVLGSYDMTWLNSLGAEWRNDLQLGQNSFLNSEFFQPLAVDKGYFVAPYLRLTDSVENLFDGNDKIAEYDIKTRGIGLGMGNQFSNWGQLRVDLSATHIDTSIDSGLKVLPANHVFQGALTGTLLVDNLDRTEFPTQGEAGGLEVLASLGALGSDDNYTKASGVWNHIHNVGPNLFALGLRAGTHFDGDLPPYDDYTLGGFLRLSGYRPGQLRGQNLGFGRLVYYRKFWELPRALGKGIYLGGSLEAGNVWAKGEGVTVESINTGGSAFLGADTIFGPLYLGYGYAGPSNNSLYLYLGKP